MLPVRALPPVMLLALALAACGTTPVAGPNPNPPPPPDRVETIPNPPVTEQQLIWQPGHWDWEGNGYSWREGTYVPQDSHKLWQPGYWAEQGGTWTWVPAHWL